jgi:hypothetical protein
LVVVEYGIVDTIEFSKLVRNLNLLGHFIKDGFWHLFYIVFFTDSDLLLRIIVCGLIFHIANVILKIFEVLSIDKYEFTVFDASEYLHMCGVTGISLLLSTKSMKLRV